MAFAPKPPKFTIPTREIGVVCYPEQKAVGLQFADPEGNHIFVTIPGAHHNDADQAGGGTYWEAWTEFLAAHLGPP